ncbi:MAG: hypothetical protein RLZ10_258 [Bacteroidota bacterium]|jgi:hypothetical protein
MEEKKIILKIDLDTSTLVKNSKEAEKQLAILREEQKKLKETTGTGTVEYAKIQEQIKQYTKQLKDNASALVINDQLKGKTNLTTIEAQKQNRALSTAYNNLTEEQRENTAEGQKITAQYKASTDALNKQFQSVGKGTYNVGLYKQAIIDANKEINGLKKEINQIGFAYDHTNKKLDETNSEMQALAKSGQQDTQMYKALEQEAQALNETMTIQKNVLDGATQELADQEKQLEATKEEARKIGFVYGEQADSLSELKKSIREATDEAIQMENQFGKDSKKYTDSIQKVGELKDRMKDLKQSTTELAGGSGFEKFGNTLGGLKNDLLSMDFEGVSEKAKTLQSISSKMTFKEVIAGAKGLGNSLLTLGKTILANPLFLLAGVIAGVVGALYYFSKETETAEAENEKLNKSFERQSYLLERQSKILIANANQKVELAKLEGKSIEEVAELQRKVNVEESALREEQIRLQRRLIEERKGAYQQAVLEENNELALSIKEQITSEKRKLQELKDLRVTQRNDIELFEKETSKAIDDRNKEEIQKSIDKFKEQKSKQDQANKDKLQAEKDLADRIRELALQGVELSNESERKLVEQKYQFLETMALGNAEKLLQLQKEKNAELAELDEKEKNDIIERLGDKYDANIKAENVTNEELTLLTANFKKELEQVDIDFNERKLQREGKYFQDEKALQEESKADKITRLEAEQIEAENILKKGGASELEILQTNSANEIKIETEKNKLIQENLNISSAQKFKAQQEYEAKVIDLTKQSADKQTEINKQKNDEFVNGTTFALNQAQAVSQAYFDVIQSNIQRELDISKQAIDEKMERLDNQLQTGLISQETYNKETAKLQKDLQKQESALKKEAWEKNKEAQRLDAIIGGAVAVINALQTKPIYAGIAMGVVTAGLTAVQIALIENQKTPKFAKGGVFGGQPHSSGGTKGVFSDGTQIEVEKDESFFILNKRATPLISQLSNLNIATGGVPLMASGGVVTVGANDSVSRVNSEVSQRNILLDVLNNLPPNIVLVEDINTGQGNLVKVQSSGDI